MRHQVAGRHLGRTSAHRRALRRNLAASLFEHETISTTIEKAKFVRPFAEKLITLAKSGTLHARRRALAMLPDRDICTIEDGEPVKTDTVINKLFNEIGPRFADRNGGYTRIIRMPLRRTGDNGTLALLQLVGEAEETERSKRRLDQPVSRETSEQVVAEPEVIEEETAPGSDETADGSADDIQAGSTPEVESAEEKDDSSAADNGEGKKE